MKPDEPKDIGIVADRNDIPDVTFWRLPVEIEEPPEQVAGAPANARGMVYTPTEISEAASEFVDEGMSVAAQCDYCGCWYFWPVRSADEISLLQCASCYRLYRKPSNNNQN